MRTQGSGCKTMIRAVHFLYSGSNGDADIGGELTQGLHSVYHIDGSSYILTTRQTWNWMYWVAVRARWRLGMQRGGWCSGRWCYVIIRVLLLEWPLQDTIRYCCVLNNEVLLHGIKAAGCCRNDDECMSVFGFTPHVDGLGLSSWHDELHFDNLNSP